MNRNRWAILQAGTLALVLLMAVEAAAQMGGVRGRVVDEKGKPLQGVEVVLALKGGGRTLKTSTNDKGEFTRAGVRPGTYQIKYFLDGYEQRVGEIKVSSGRPMEMGTVTLAKLPEGVLTEKEHAEAQKLLKEAQSASGTEDYQATIESLKKFIELVPDSAEAYFNIAAAYEKMDDKENAIANYKKAVELNPGLYDAWLALGDLYGSVKKFQEGMEALGKALEIRPNETTVRFNYGAYAFNAGDMETAEAAFQQLIQQDPNHAMGHYQLGVIKVGQGEKEEAIAHLEKYLELDPEGSRAETVKGLLETLKKS